MKQVIRIVLVTAFFAVAAQPAVAAEGTVSRAQFTSAILDREPVDELTAIDPDADKVFFFTELRNMEGTAITHRWSLNGNVMAEVEFKVRASRWRVYSSKTLLPEWRGEWVVDVVDESGSIIESRKIGYAGAEMPAPEAPKTGDSTTPGTADDAEPATVDGGQADSMTGGGQQDGGQADITTGGGQQ